MSDHTELFFVLNKRNEAAKFLRQHNEAASQTGAIYAAAARHVGVFRDALRESGYGATSLAGAVRTASALIANMAVPTTRAAAEVDDLGRGFEGTRDVLQDVTAGTVAQERAQSSLAAAASPAADSRAMLATRHAVLGHSSIQSSVGSVTRMVGPDAQGSEIGRAAQKAETLFDDLVDVKRALAAARAVIDSSDRAPVEGPSKVAATRGSRPTDGRVPWPRIETSPESPGLNANDRTLVAATVDDLKTAFGTMLRSPPGLTRDDNSIVAGSDRGVLAEVLDRVEPGIDLEKLLDPLHQILEVSIGLRRDLQVSALQSRPTEREVWTVPSTSRARESGALDLERLSVELRERLRAAAEVGGTWTGDHRDMSPGPLDARRPAIAVPEWTDQGRAPDGSTGGYLRANAEDWQAYGRGLANAMGATDQALAAILTQTKDWRSAMHGLINAVVTDFAKIAIRQNVTGPLAEMVLGSGKGGDTPGLLGSAWNWITSLFAGGGIMTGHGPVPLRAYASGGIATSPQLALFGEGSTPEAYVPVPNGRIPVTLRGGGSGIGSIATSIVINMTGGGDTGRAAAGSDPAEQARNIGALVTAAFNRNLAEQMRPGGLLNPAGYLGNGLAH